MTRGLLPAALVAIGLITFIRGDLAGDHRLLAVGVAIVGAAILTAIAGWVLRRPDEAAQVDLRDWTSYLTQSTERGFLIVRLDQAELYERAVRAIGAARVLYDEVGRDDRTAPIETAPTSRDGLRHQGVRIGVDTSTATPQLCTDGVRHMRGRGSRQNLEDWLRRKTAPAPPRPKPTRPPRRPPPRPPAPPQPR